MNFALKSANVYIFVISLGRKILLSCGVFPLRRKREREREETFPLSPSFLFQRVGGERSTSSRRNEGAREREREGGRASWLVSERRKGGDRGRATFLGVEAQEATWRIDRVALASTTTPLSSHPV